MEVGFLAALAIALAFFIGIRVGASGNKNEVGFDEPKGILNVAYDDACAMPELFLNLQAPVDDIVSKKRVVFYVNVIRQNSQK